MSKNRNPRVKTTFSLDRNAFETFAALIRSVGLRRDTYLNNVLADGIDYLEKLGENSPDAEGWLRESHGHDPLFSDPDTLIRVNLTLESSLISRLNEACATKRIPRDIFMDEFLRYVMGALGVAEDYLFNPHASHGGNAHNPYAHLCLSDEEVRRAREQYQEDLRLAEAVARVHRAGINEAREAIDKLSPEDRERLASNPKVREELDRLDRAPNLAHL